MIASRLNPQDILLGSIILLLSCHFISCSVPPRSRRKSLPKFDMAQFITDLGYPVEVHEDLRTDDGYLLTMYRIPHGKNNKADPRKSPVLLMHGLGSFGFHWVSAGPKHSYAFLLADQGYDVWIGNARGTSYSKKHERYDPERNPDKFWDFSWHEIGYYDLYTKINHVLDTTKHSKLFYIGHSQGTTSYFVLMSMRPEMNEKVKLMVALAPVVYFSESLIIRPESHALDIFHGIDRFRQLVGVHSVGTRIKELVCSPQFPIKICDFYLSMLLSLIGLHKSKVRPEHYELILRTFPEEASAKQFLHYTQTTISGEWRLFHLGTSENLQKYGSELPPKYNIRKISSPIALLVGDQDTLAPLENIQRMLVYLPNIADFQVIPNTSHLDFLAVDESVRRIFAEISFLFNNYHL